MTALLRQEALPIHRTRELASAGLNASAPARSARARHATRIRSGVYCDTAPWEALSPERQHRILVAESNWLLRDSSVVSHRSAAVMLGIPLLGPPPQRVHVTSVRGTGGLRSTHVQHHTVKEPPGRVLVDGVRCTTPVRTALDVARSGNLADGLIALDHVLHERRGTPGEFMAELRRLQGMHGSRKLRLIAELADSRVESPGESLSRARMHELGVPRPHLQFEFHDESGLIGRGDFWWPELGILGEFDGRAKYGVGRGAMDVDANDVVFREKLREDRIRHSHGARVIRWGWEDALDPVRFERIMRRAGLL